MNLALAAIGACALFGCTDTPHVSGRVCVVLDLRYPRECPGHQLVGGLDVVEVGTGLTGVTDDDGSFRIETPKALDSAVIRVGPGSSPRLSSLAMVQGDDVHDAIVPQIATPVWQSYLAQFGGTDDPTLGNIHASYETPPGLFVAHASASGAAQLFYNQGNAFDWALTPPGDQVVAVLGLGVPPGTTSLTLTLQDDTMTSLDEPIEAGTITWVNLAN